MLADGAPSTPVVGKAAARPTLLALSRDLIWLVICIATLALWSIGIVRSPLPGWIVEVMLLAGGALFLQRIRQSR
jgi:hypothetical protein